MEEGCRPTIPVCDIFLLLEATRQLRGESTSQVDDAKLAIAHGNGGMLGARHSAGTVILGRN